jgi:hypothetical protein
VLDQMCVSYLGRLGDTYAVHPTEAYATRALEYQQSIDIRFFRMNHIRLPMNA